MKKVERKTKRPGLDLSPRRLLISPPPSAARKQDYPGALKPYMALPCHTLARTGRLVTPFTFKHLRYYRDITDSPRPEDAAVALDFSRRAERFRIIVGKLHGRMAFNTGYFADEADGIEAGVAAWIATAEVVGE